MERATTGATPQAATPAPEPPLGAGAEVGPAGANRVGRLDECIQWLVRRFYVRRFIQGSLRDLGTAEVFVLAALGRVPRARMTDLARASGIPLSTLTGVLDRLVARGYARRTHGAEDRREVLAVLTARGRRVQQEYLEARMEMCAGMLEALGEEKGERLVESLARIRQALGEWR